MANKDALVDPESTRTPKRVTQPFMTLTPKVRPLELDRSPNMRSSELSKAILERLGGFGIHPEDHIGPMLLTSVRDLEFFRGFAAAYSLRFGADLVKMLSNNYEVEVLLINKEG